MELGLGDLSSFASLAANLQSNPEAFNTLSNMMNNISGGGSSSNAMSGGSMMGKLREDLRLLRSFLLVICRMTSCT